MIVEIPYNKDNLIVGKIQLQEVKIFFGSQGILQYVEMYFFLFFLLKNDFGKETISSYSSFLQAGKPLIDMIKIKAQCSFISYSLVTLAMVSSMCSTVKAKCV